MENGMNSGRYTVFEAEQWMRKRVGGFLFFLQSYTWKYDELLRCKRVAGGVEVEVKLC